MPLTLSIANKLSIYDVGFTGKRVLIRVDFNVPFTKDGKVADANRILQTIPTIQYIMQKGPSQIVLMSHLGRPDGQVNKKYSLEPVVPTLEKLLGKKVVFLHDCVGPEVNAALANASNGSIFLLENLRFHLEEEGSVKVKGKKVKADAEDIKDFRAALSRMGDIFVQDAFGSMHRAHSSITGINTPLRCAGFLVEKELDYFAQALEQPQKPFVAILGGAKVADKIKLIENLIEKVDELVIGGGMAYTFLKIAQNVEIGKSIFDKHGATLVKGIMKKAEDHGVKIHLPVDFVTAEKKSDESRVFSADVATGIPSHLESFDIGPKTVELFKTVIQRAKTVVWNGPLGVFELKPFQNGTKNVMIALAEVTMNNGCISIIGGGDSALAAEQFHVASKVSHVSTGGGASLELLEGNSLPGVKSLSSKKLRTKLPSKL